MRVKGKRETDGTFFLKMARISKYVYQFLIYFYEFLRFTRTNS